MQTLSNGFLKPDTGDFGSDWFPALEQDIQQLNDHTHNGVDSETLPSNILIANYQTLLSGSFVDQGDGYWKANVTVPVGSTVDNTVFTIRDPTTKDNINLKIIKISSFAIEIYTNTVQNFEVYFGV